MQRQSLIQRKFNRSNRQGAMLPFIAVAIIILFVACAIGIDIARMHVTRSELRTATDAAARAAMEALSREQNQQSAVEAALAVANLNAVAGNGLDLEIDNIVFGTNFPNDDGSFTFQPNGPIVNAVRVLGSRQSDSPDGSVGMFFGGLFGTDNFEPVQSATAMRLDRDIALVLDKSGSMGVAGRFPALLNAVDVFLGRLNQSIPDERVSLTVYDTNPQKLVNMTSNTGAIQAAINRQTPGGFTGIGRALQVGLDSIQNDPGVRPFALKSVILMTDGRQNRGVGPEVIADQAARLGITVHTITFSNGANQALMREVAEKTGGIHLHAENNQDLIEAFEEIANVLQVLLTE